MRPKAGTDMLELHRALCAHLAEPLPLRLANGERIDFDYLHPSCTLYDKGLKVWPDDVRWVACYVVEGDSEGHYLHVDAICIPPNTSMFTAQYNRMWTGKTFAGAAHAWAIARAIAEYLEA